MPQSRHRKTAKARKRPKGTFIHKGTGSTTAKNERRVKILAIVVGAALVLAVTGYFFWLRDGGAKQVTTASGLKYQDLVEGTGPTPQKGQTVSVAYTGSRQSDGFVFDSTAKHGGKPLDFKLGHGDVIPGWEEAVATMKVGGKRHLIIPPKLGYGAVGRGSDIPPNATLLFDVELVSVK